MFFGIYFRYKFIQSSLHGYNVTIMAFGQTGSGKTYTMRGGDGESDEGIIPRAVRFIFDHQKSMKELAWQVSDSTG